MPKTEKELNLALPKEKPPSHLVAKDLRQGWGLEAQQVDALVTEFIAKFVTGKPFESSWQTGSPFIFHLGKERPIPVGKRSLRGIKVGGGES